MMIAKYRYLVIAALVSVFATSCDKGIDMVEYSSTVYMPQAGVVEVTPLLGESVYQTSIYWAGHRQEESNITVYLKLDKDSLARYNIANPAGAYQLLPETYYDLPQMTVPLTGERTLLNIRIKNIDERFSGKNYVLPLSIESTGPVVNVEPTKKTVFLRFSRFRNVYEGSYKAYGPVVEEGSNVETSKVDEVLDAKSVHANVVSVNGAENNMTLLLAVQSDGSVTVSGAPGSESYQVANMDGYKSVFTGAFDAAYQQNWGAFDLYYQYMLGEIKMYVHVQLKSWQ